MTDIPNFQEATSKVELLYRDLLLIDGMLRGVQLLMNDYDIAVSDTRSGADNAIVCTVDALQQMVERNTEFTDKLLFQMRKLA